MNLLLSMMVLGATAPLVCDQHTIDRGVVKGGPALVQVFRLENKAADTIEILDVTGSCGCVRNHLSTRSIAPGTTAELTIEINTLTQPDGPNTWRFTVRYKSQAQERQLQVQLLAKLVREVNVTPPMMAISTGDEAIHEFTITDRRPQPLSVKAAVGTAAWLKTEIRRGAGQTTVRLLITSETPVGIHDAAVLVTTSDAEYPEFRVPVRVNKHTRSQILMSPDVLDLRKEGETAVGLVQFRSVDRKNLKIQRAESVQRGVILKWSQTEGPVATLRVEVSPLAGAKGKADVTVHFETPDGVKQTLPIQWSSD